MQTIRLSCTARSVSVKADVDKECRSRTGPSLRSCFGNRFYVCLTSLSRAIYSPLVILVVYCWCFSGILAGFVVAEDAMRRVIWP
jgi:hypothetical protein